MPRYLITGAAGFIGSRVAEALLDEGHEVDGLDNVCDAYDPALKRWRLDRLLGRDRFLFVEGDVAEGSAAADLFASASRTTPYDGVVNLAARAGIRPSVSMPEEYYRTNLLGTLNLLECCRRHGVRSFVLASSSSVYGGASAVPFSEGLPTDHQMSPYAASKKAAEELCTVYGYLHGIRSICPRYFTVYGPAGRPDMSIFRFVQRISEGVPIAIYGDGNQRRDLSYVDDIVAGTLLALRSDRTGPVNLGGDHPVRLLDLVGTIEQLVGRRAELRFESPHPADARETWADITRAREWLGWQPLVGWSDGLERTVRWYRENRDFARTVRTD
jgi:UDP-glucuronate 4-epimerase